MEDDFADIFLAGWQMSRACHFINFLGLAI
jgi:hypothetical protein